MDLLAALELDRALEAQLGSHSGVSAVIDLYGTMCDRWDALEGKLRNGGGSPKSEDGTGWDSFVYIYI